MVSACLTNRHRTVLLFIVLLLASLVLSMPKSFCADVTQADAKQSIAAAQQELNTCYAAVADANSAGANVTTLILVLDQSGGDLSMANLAFAMGNYSSAQSYAAQSFDLLTRNDIVARAEALRNDASQAGYWDFVINIVSSLVGTVAVLVAGVVVWVVLERRSKRTASVSN